MYAHNSTGAHVRKTYAIPHTLSVSDPIIYHCLFNKGVALTFNYRYGIAAKSFLSTVGRSHAIGMRINKPLLLLTITVVGLFLTTAIPVGYGSISPPLSFSPRYQDPQDPNNMTKTCGNLEDQLNSGRGVLPMDVLACFDYLDNATLIKQGLNPADKEIPLDQRDTPLDIQPYELPTAPTGSELRDGDENNGNGDGDNGDE